MPVEMHSLSALPAQVGEKIAADLCQNGGVRSVPMTTYPPPCRLAIRSLALNAALAIVLLLHPLLLVSSAAEASWLTKVMGAAETAGARTAKLGLGALDNAAAHVKALPATAADRSALAAQATQEGHWRFVNRAGETFTAGTPDEMKRVASVLLPDAKADAKLALYITEDTILLNRAALKELP